MTNAYMTIMTITNICMPRLKHKIQNINISKLMSCLVANAIFYVCEMMTNLYLRHWLEFISR